MITQQVTAIALKLFSLWLLAQLILNFPGLVMLANNLEQYPQQTVPKEAYLGIMVTFILVGLIAVFLIYRASNSVLKTKKSKSEICLSKDSQKALFQLAGLFFIVDALAYLPHSLSFIPNSASIDVTYTFWPAGLVFQLFIGLWLVSASGFWLKLLRRLRGQVMA